MRDVYKSFMQDVIYLPKGGSIRGVKKAATRLSKAVVSANKKGLKSVVGKQGLNAAKKTAEGSRLSAVTTKSVAKVKPKGMQGYSKKDQKGDMKATQRGLNGTARYVDKNSKPVKKVAKKKK